MFLLVQLGKSKCFHSCRTRVVCVALMSYFCRTCVAHVSLVLHSCRICLACVALVSLVPDTRVLN